ncbi:ANKRD52 [Symbiodinium sp. KB8]|nr:ANKRD52 [Symbiodinium sp. KB8]
MYIYICVHIYIYIYTYTYRRDCPGACVFAFQLFYIEYGNLCGTSRLQGSIGPITTNDTAPANTDAHDLNKPPGDESNTNDTTPANKDADDLNEPPGDEYESIDLLEAADTDGKKVIHRFEGNGLKEDWLSSKHKDFLDKYKGGQFVKYPGYEKALESEAALIGNLLASPEEKEYMRRAATYDSWATLIRMSQPQRRLHLAPAPRRLQQEMTVSQELELHLADSQEADTLSNNCVNNSDLDADEDRPWCGAFQSPSGIGDFVQRCEGKLNTLQSIADAPEAIFACLDVCSQVYSSHSGDGGHFRAMHAAAVMYYLALNEFPAADIPMNFLIGQELSPSSLQTYDEFIHEKIFPPMKKNNIYEVVMDGNAKVHVKCPGDKQHADKPRANGKKKPYGYGWFMAVHPGTQRILAVSCLKKPEGHDVVDDVLTRILPKYKNMNGVIIDRVCSFLPRAKSQAKFRQIKHWSVDFFHAHGHNASCPCNPHHIPRLARHFKGINTSAAEQVFAWFRNYARVLNEATAMRHSFKVLYFCKVHNTAMQKDGSSYLSQYPHKGQRWGLTDQESKSGAEASLQKAALKFLALPRSSLGGLTARKVKEAGPEGNPGESARAATAEWRRAAADLLLSSPAAEGLVSHQDSSGRTALHHAAAAGDAHMVEVLLNQGAEKDAKDRHGRSPAHIAAVRRHGEVARMLAETAEEAQQRDAFGHTVQGILQEQTRSEVPAVQSDELSLESEAFLRQYVAMNQPVLIKGGAFHMEAMAWSDYRFLTTDLGREVVQAAPVPYAKNMGLPGAVDGTLSEMLASPQVWRSEEPDSNEPQTPPLYVFDASVLRRRRDLVKASAPLRQSFMEKHCSHVRVPQLGVGFRGAGAPMHLGGLMTFTGFRVLGFGFLIPPEAAAWSLDPAGTWEQTAEYRELRNSGKLFEVVQECGDILFVPEGWGHATILDSYAVGVAQEFVPWASINGSWSGTDRNPHMLLERSERMNTP